MKTKFSFGDFLFWFQLVLGFVFGGFQVHHMILHSTRGLSTSMFLCTSVFLVINLHLAVAAHFFAPSKVTRQTIVIYGTGVLIYGSLLVVMFWKAESGWDQYDTSTGIVVAIGVLLTLLYSLGWRVKILDPVIKGMYSLVFKSVPQLMMAIKIATIGGSGLNVVSLVVFHVLTLSRIYQIVRGIREAGWDRNRKGLAIAEMGNECTWVVVTIAWTYDLLF